jgi:hypothetical protein
VVSPLETAAVQLNSMFCALKDQSLSRHSSRAKEVSRPCLTSWPWQPLRADHPCDRLSGELLGVGFGERRLNDRWPLGDRKRAGENG